ncbi:NRDE family protein [Ferruginibacter sp.]
MCTVAFIPGKGNYYFASLRDENPGRHRALPPSLFTTINGNYIAPTDPLGGGTWVGANEFGNVIILLNGGFTNHIKKKRYAKSRGTIVKELLADSMPVVEWNLMKLENIEPFTLIVWTDEKLFELVWDGEQKHRFNLSNNQPHIWSSATLYNDDVKNIRSVLFKKWIATAPVVTNTSLLNFFKSNNDTNNGFLINRSAAIKTLSYTFIELLKNKTTTLQYLDFTFDSNYCATITLSDKEQSCVL